MSSRRAAQHAPSKIAYHEVQRGQYDNVYWTRPSRWRHLTLTGRIRMSRVAAWRTAVEAAPWLVGGAAREVPPDEPFKKLEPFEERVAADTKEGKSSPPQNDGA